MPLISKKIGDKWRAVERDSGRIAKRADGSPVDKGGFKTRAPVIRRITPINISEARKAGKNIPKFTLE